MIPDDAGGNSVDWKKFRLDEPIEDPNLNIGSSTHKLHDFEQKTIYPPPKTGY